MLPLKYYFHNPDILGISVLQNLFWWIPDELYLKLLYRLNQHEKLKLKNPRTFCEKLQWLKLFDRRPEYTGMVDKVEVKKYVAGIIGEEYIIPTIGVWKRPEDIGWGKLPNQFVLKCSHGGGSSGVVVCADKKTFNIETAITKLSKGLQQDIYKEHREWPYKNVVKQVFAENYICPDGSDNDLKDYKWYCFNGKPTYCQVIQNRSIKETIDFFDTEWIHQDFIGLNPGIKNADEVPHRPKALDEQLDIARQLSSDIPCVRVDLYEVNGRVYFGELTFYPASGMGEFSPKEYDEKLGRMLVLPSNTKI